ncbi:ferritin-like domain-containing protein [Pseudarthrobacter sp. AL07]|uniref:ferritin-like domain-containing protein n=1 Tax=unclassified Pseudarthrobacter TaxID=2647000 RepID=UPI00249B9E42|nr:MULTISPECIES: ferritin-like domain-containing protein [unclassified Pseudarthrobacter]MDI3196219.1 ferritin-like domain-containing protein [Pseudarthrobacter sp. AL20]MDI3210288.1 ferritin-like domain-containing protein [Pseudarthrobacter sp. AL07]
MFDQKFITNAMARSAENSLDRRRLFRAAGAAGIGGTVALLSATSAAAHTDQEGPSDAAILNFALNLEYLEAEFYLRAVTGVGLADSLTDGKGKKGGVTGGSQVPFTAGSLIQKYAVEIAADEEAHVRFLRSALGKAAVARPPIDLDASFTAAALAAGLITAGQTFSPFTDETSFLLGAFIFEDVGVTAYKGAAPFIDNKTYLEAAAGILAVEAYHAGIIRTTMYAQGLQAPAQAISDARDSLDGTTDLDQGIGTAQEANLVPTDANALAFSRTPAQVLNIAYLTAESVKSGGFFPHGVNGKLNRSGGS